MQRKTRRQSNPVAKNMERWNKPKTIAHNKEKVKRGYTKYLKQEIEKQMEEDYES